MQRKFKNLESFLSQIRNVLMDKIALKIIQFRFNPSNLCITKFPFVFWNHQPLLHISKPNLLSQLCHKYYFSFFRRFPWLMSTTQSSKYKLTYKNQNFLPWFWAKFIPNLMFWVVLRPEGHSYSKTLRDLKAGLPDILMFS